MGSCQGPAREREPVPSARRLKHNLAIILVSTFYIRRRGRREKAVKTYNKDSSFSGIHLPEQILLFLLGQWQERLKVSRQKLYRWSGVWWGGCKSLVWPPHLSPLLSWENTKDPVKVLVVSASAKPVKPQKKSVWIWLKLPPMTNQETKTKASVCEQTCSFSDLFVQRCRLWWNITKYIYTSTVLMCLYFSWVLFGNVV